MTIHESTDGGTTVKILVISDNENAEVAEAIAELIEAEFDIIANYETEGGNAALVFVKVV